MVFVEILVGLMVVWFSYRCFRLQGNIKKARNFIGSRFFFDSNDPIVMLDLLPHWMSVEHHNWASKYTFHKKFSADVFASITPNRITYQVADPEIIKEIYILKKDTFLKPTQLYGVLEIFGKNIVTTEGELWRKHRKVVSAGFVESNNRLVFSETVRHVEDLIKGVMGSGEERMNASKAVTNIALHVICNAGFGFYTCREVEDVPEDGFKMSFFSALEEIVGKPVPLVLFPDWLLHIPFSGLPKLLCAKKDFLGYIKQRTQKAIQTITTNQAADKKDLFTLLIRNSLGEGAALSDSELVANVFVLLMAGHETTAHTITLALGLLALNPQFQEEFYNEIMSVLGTRSVLEYEDIAKVKWAKAIMNETLRLYPQVPSIPKWTQEDVTVGPNKIFMPAGSIININLAGLHYNEKYWKEPFLFNPRRFLGEYNRDAFLPFSDGPRVCIGKRFAQIEGTTILIMMVKNFKLQIPPGVNKESFLDGHQIITLTPKRDIMVQLKPRQS